MNIDGKFNINAEALVNRIFSHDKYGRNDLNKWIFNFMQHKKKDDLADSFLQGLWYIKYKNYE